jgi:hypothetical protein
MKYLALFIILPFMWFGEQAVSDVRQKRAVNSMS